MGVEKRCKLTAAEPGAERPYTHEQWVYNHLRHAELHRSLQEIEASTPRLVAGADVNRDHFLRCALWASVAYNLGGGLLFAFPSSALGQLAGMPSPVPPLYSSLLALFVLLFGGAYAWLACQPNIDRPLVALAAIGKAGVFVLLCVAWLLGEAPGRGVLVAIGDLIFASIFTWWLLGAQQRVVADISTATR